MNRSTVMKNASQVNNKELYARDTRVQVKKYYGTISEKEVGNITTTRV